MMDRSCSATSCTMVASAAVVAALTIFSIDVRLMSGEPVWAVYVVPVVFAGETGRRWITWAVATVVVALIVLGAHLSPAVGGATLLPSWLLERVAAIALVVGGAAWASYHRVEISHAEAEEIVRRAREGDHDLTREQIDDVRRDGWDQHHGGYARRVPMLLLVAATAATALAVLQRWG